MRRFSQVGYTVTMRKRLVISILAAAVYTAVFAGILTWQGREVLQTDLVTGAFVFAVTFYLVRTWLDSRRDKKDVLRSSEEDSQM